ncbi:hypothetical protein [Kaarinaea lacus]
MVNKTHLKNWHDTIISLCTKRLQRSLTQEEQAFVTGYVGFMALEGIEDAVKTLSIEALEELLNSKTNE